MAEEKKRKIDLKARLGKGSAASAATPAPAAALPDGAVVPPPSTPPVGASGPGLPVPPGVPVGPSPALDPNNPLAAVVAGRSMSAPAPAQAQRIEVDEMAVQQAASRARKTGFVFAGIALVAGMGVGFVGGQAQETGAGRTQAKMDAKELKDSVDAAKKKIDEVASKIEDGVKMLGEGKQFPKDLSNQLGGINVDFDGSKLAGRRFAGFPTDTSAALFDFVTNVTALNDHKTAVKNLLSKLEKPVSEQFAAAASGQHSIQYIALIGGATGKDPAGNYVADLAVLTPALTFSGDNLQLPAEFKASVRGQGITVSKAKGGAKIDEPAAMYISPRSFDAVCPSATKGLVAQLAVKLGDLITEIRGQPKASEDIVSDAKPGLLEQADNLSKALDKIANSNK